MGTILSLFPRVSAAVGAALTLRTLLRRARTLARPSIDPQALPPDPRDVGLPPEWLAIAPANRHRLFRLVGKDPPRERDFQSDKVKNRPRFAGDHEADHLALSMFATEAQALSMARRYPKIVAEVALPAGHGFGIARTMLDLEGHYSVWGDPAGLLDRVSSVSRQDDE